MTALLTRSSSGSNIASANNRTCAAIDYDDLAITAGTYIGPASGGGGGGSTDTTPPTVTAFVMPATSTSLTVAVTSFKASDNVAVTGLLSHVREQLVRLPVVSLGAGELHLLRSGGPDALRLGEGRGRETYRAPRRHPSRSDRPRPP